MNEVNPEPKKHKNPILAALLVPLLGIGYVYLGCRVRLIIYLVVTFGFFPVMALLRISNVPPIINLLILVCFMLDAYTVAVKQNGGAEGRDETVMF